MKAPISERLSATARELASPLPPLLVEAERIANTVAAGAHGRRRVGPGESFWQFRQYMEGDSITRVDWRRSARSDQLYVRQNEWAAAQTVWLWRDGSASMRYGSTPGGGQKIDRAGLLLLALAILLVRGGERIGWLDSDSGPGGGQVALRRLALALSQAPSADAAGRPADRVLPRHARLVLIGDFLDPLDLWEALLHGYAAQGIRGHMLQVLDPAEEDLPFTGRNRFSGLEGDGDVLVGRVEGLADAYRARIAARRDTLVRLAHAAGWTFTAHRTDRPPQTALLALHNAVAGLHGGGAPGGAS